MTYISFMGISERKQRAWAERETLILTHADRLLGSHGYLGLNLDHLAQEIEYSKATIYNHFQSKEDLVVAVSARHARLRSALFSYALEFEGLTREKMMVIGIAADLMAREYPHCFELSQLSQTASIWEKASEETQQIYTKHNQATMQVAGEIIGQAKACGDLPEHQSNNTVLCGLASITKGAHLLGNEPMIQEIGPTHGPADLLLLNCHIYLDGLGWKPVMNDYTYAESESRIRNQFFSTPLPPL